MFTSIQTKDGKMKSLIQLRESIHLLSHRTYYFISLFAHSTIQKIILKFRHTIIDVGSYTS